MLHRLRRLRSNARVLSWNAGFRLAGAFDGVPIPPTRLIYLSTNGKVIGRFLYGGKMCHDSIVYAVTKSGHQIENFGSILEFGCGCGRVIRYWKNYTGPRVYGTDYNEDAIAWCKQHLGGIAEFNTNKLSPPLSYADGQFDFVYAISVFTHLTEELQYAWMNELRRILKPGGLLLISVLGDSRLSELADEERKRYLAGELIVKYQEQAGANVCGAYHPQQYVRTRLAEGFEVVGFDDVGLRDANQDIYLLKKRPG